MRTASRLIGHEHHQAARITFTAPLRGPQHFRNALRKGGLNQPLLVVPTDDPRTFFLVGQPSHLQQVNAVYSRYANIVRNRIPNLPTITVSEPATLVSFASILPQSTALYRHELNKHNRLCDTTFGAKCFFLETLITGANAIIELITEHAPSHPLVAEHKRITEILNSSTPPSQ